MRHFELHSRAMAAACVVVCAVATLAGLFVPSPQPQASDARHRPLDQLLDLYVRDGLVYYAALKADRAKLDRYLASLEASAAAYERWTAAEQLAFWINTYNAFALKTVIDHYPIRGSAPDYPPNSIRQVPGAFDRLTTRAAGRAVTLDGIEKEILPSFRDPRAYFALGRGSVGGGRLRSEAFTAEHLNSQLQGVIRELPTRANLFRIDRDTNRLVVTPIVGWHEPEFTAVYSAVAPVWKERSPIERAVLALVMPHLLPAEVTYLEKNQFAMAYAPYDWSLNDLTGR